MCVFVAQKHFLGLPGTDIVIDLIGVVRLCVHSKICIYRRAYRFNSKLFKYSIIFLINKLVTVLLIFEKLVRLLIESFNN